MRFSPVPFLFPILFYFCSFGKHFFIARKKTRQAKSRRVVYAK